MSDSRIFICSDGHRLAYNLWLPENKEAKAFVQILHGMAEYSDRYDNFAKFLNKKGYAVFAADHRGHGHTADGETLGWFADSDGWNRIAADAFEIANYISTLYHTKQMFLFGHSMGSFLARTVMVQHPDFYSGVVAMGTSASMGIVGKLGILLAKMQIKKNGSKTPGETLDKVAFSSYNKMIENPRTKFDWLSTDNKNVDKYVADPLCGFTCTNGFFLDLFHGLDYANSKANASILPKDLPLLIISGDQDPVGAYGKGVKKVYELYKNVGIADVELKLFEGCRHELLNEVCKKDVYEYLLAWFDRHI